MLRVLALSFDTQEGNIAGNVGRAIRLIRQL